MPTVGTDWYPVVIDSYTTAEYADLDAYLASEYGSELLPGCGCSALVPLATAIQRLADNDINITVIEPQTLFNREFDGADGPLLVNSQGQLVYFTEGDNKTFFLGESDAQRYFMAIEDNIQPIIEAWGSSSLGTWTAGSSKTVTVDGVSYTFTPVDDTCTLTPAAGTYSE